MTKLYDRVLVSIGLAKVALIVAFLAIATYVFFELFCSWCMGSSISLATIKGAVLRVVAGLWLPGVILFLSLILFCLLGPFEMSQKDVLLMYRHPISQLLRELKKPIGRNRTVEKSNVDTSENSVRDTNDK